MRYFIQAFGFLALLGLGGVAAHALVTEPQVVRLDNPQKVDIFRNDAETRKAATTEALRWTVEMGGCTGSMLTPEYMLTANHCSPSVGSSYTSGGCKILGCRSDIRVAARQECSSAFDYCVLRVEWPNAEAKRMQRFPPSVQTLPEQLVFGRDGKATKLFTVGFPVDKGMRATYAEGWAKEYSSNFMSYNIGSINGNSGGAVYAYDTRMLVGMTNHGPHAHGQPGWNNNDPENPRAWNGGPRMDKVYAKSPTFQQLFPGGKNPLVNDCGQLK